MWVESIVCNISVIFNVVFFETQCMFKVSAFCVDASAQTLAEAGEVEPTSTVVVTFSLFTALRGVNRILF